MAAADTNRKRTCAANFTSINILWCSVCSTARCPSDNTLCRPVTPCDATMAAANYAGHWSAAVSQSSHAACLASICLSLSLALFLSLSLTACLPACLPVDIRLDEYLNCLYCWWISAGSAFASTGSWYEWKCLPGRRLQLEAAQDSSGGWLAGDCLCLLPLDKCLQWAC